MEFQSFQAKGDANIDRAIALMQEAKTLNPACSSLIGTLIDSLSVAMSYFIEARDSSGKLCGVLKYDFQDDDGEFVYIWLLCSNCKGTGTALINKAAEVARENGISQIGLSATRSSVGFYEKMGFAQMSHVDPADKYVDMRRAVGGRRKTYRRRKSRRHGSASLRRHKTRRVLP
jgi:ribosomal protein S18 acetylase RimI-like enzyme